MTGLSQHMADAYELPPEWQEWLDKPEIVVTDEHEVRGAPNTTVRLRPEPETPWRIENDHVATWALRKLGQAEEQRRHVEELARAEIERIEEWKARELRRPTRDAEFFRSHLSAYWRRQMDALMAPMLERGMTPEEAWDELKRKSLSLPTGTLTARRTPAGVEVVDEEAFVRWAQENGYTELLRAKPALDALKALPAEGDAVYVEIPGSGGPSPEPPDRYAVPGVKPKPVEYRYDAKPDVGTGDPE
jgi:phage host-nuclease inhibitor protein Gam